MAIKSQFWGQENTSVWEHEGLCGQRAGRRTEREGNSLLYLEANIFLKNTIMCNFNLSSSSSVNCWLYPVSYIVKAETPSGPMVRRQTSALTALPIIMWISLICWPLRNSTAGAILQTKSNAGVSKKSYELANIEEFFCGIERLMVSRIELYMYVQGGQFQEMFLGFAYIWSQTGSCH